MPLYEYICHACGKTAELLVSGGRKPACPHCGSTQLEKQLSRFSAQVAGTDTAFDMPACASGGCPARSGGCAGGSCPHIH